MIVNSQKFLEYYLVCKMQNWWRLHGRTIFCVGLNFQHFTNSIFHLQSIQIDLHVKIKSTAFNSTFVKLQSCKLSATYNHCTSNPKKKSNEIIPLKILKRKWTVFPIQWGRCEFEIEKYWCEPVNVFRWEYTSTLDKVLLRNDWMNILHEFIAQ